MSPAELIRFRGTVQGVGFRPTVARLAREHGLSGWVRNDGEGVLVSIAGDAARREAFVGDLLRSLPPLAQVDAVERDDLDEAPDRDGFTIEHSAAGSVRTAAGADAVICAACAEEIRDPFSRRYRYPFTCCTHCGPRFSILRALPYDRASTTMAGFTMCVDCQAEYDDPSDRRYHAQPVACGRCGPEATLVRTDGNPVSFASYSMLDDVDACRTLMLRGEIVAIKGLGGYQLCCDATNEAAVARLRERKARPDKPLAMLASDLEQIQRFCTVSEAEAAALHSPAGPIVLLPADGPEQVAPSVAPGQNTLGFMLPSTPLHRILMRLLRCPIVCTSGNRSEEPQCIDEEDMLARLGDIADWALTHNRPIANRVDDSVVRLIAGEIRPLRRARGLAPAPILLHPGFQGAAPLTALGGHLKSTFCLLRGRQAILSPHIGDLDEPRTISDYGHILRTLSALVEHAPDRAVLDLHPGYRTHELARAALPSLPVERVGHHHAHVAACMADNGMAPDAGPVLGIVLDGLGMGEDGTLWGGELLAADFHSAERLAALPATPMLGGDQAARAPWRSALAHLDAALGPDGMAAFADLPAVAALLERRSPLLDQALERAPRASSTGRLFDAVAALLGLHAERTTFEAQAPMALEALAATVAADRGYPMPLGAGPLPRFVLAPMWEALLNDLRAGVSAAMVAARFHEGLAQGLASAAYQLRAGRPALQDVALSGGVWQNAILCERVAALLTSDGWRVLLHRRTPSNDGGIALGQAAIAAARALRAQE